MASSLRYRIAERIVGALRDTLPSYSYNENGITSLVRVSTKKSDHPTLLFPWESFLEMNKDIKSLHPDALLPKLKREGVVSADGILDVTLMADDNLNLSFTIHKQKFVQEILHNTYKHLEEKFSSSSYLQSIPYQRIVVDYSSPNIAKPFHAGHLRSTIIGNFIANLHQYFGHHVSRINYLGDWGTQYGLLSLGYNEFGSAVELKKDPLNHLLQVYIAANKISMEDDNFLQKAKKRFSQIENGDETLLSEWKKFRNLSITEYTKIYKRLGITFDEYHGESMYSSDAQNIVSEIREKFQLEKTSEGSVEYLLPVNNDQTMKVTLEKSDGSTLYLSRDIAAAIDRKKKYKFDRAYYVVDNAQSDHFVSLCGMLKIMGYDWYSSLHHVKFGRIQGMSARKGNLVYLKDLLDEAKAKAMLSMRKSPTTKVTDNIEETADILGISAIIINDFKCRRLNNYNFSWERALHLKGNSGLSLQYNYARLCSIEENCGIGIKPYCETHYLWEPEALQLVQHIGRFDEVLLEAYKQLEPCILTIYLFTLCNHIGKANKILPVKNQDRVVARSRLLLFHVSRKVLYTGMKILGLQPLTKM